MQTRLNDARFLKAAVLAGLLAGASAAAGTEDAQGMPQATANDTASEDANMQARGSDESREAAQQVTAATEVLSKMKGDAGTQGLLERAQGVFIVPQFGRGAAVVGARGGEGVLVVRNGGDWTGPVFYDYGGLSVGAQAGGKGGSIVMLLMSERAVDRFQDDTDFSLTADAGLTIAEYSQSAQASVTDDDIVVWSDTEGLFAGAAIGVTGIRPDPDDNRAYYNQEAASTEQIILGSVTNPQAEQLREQLPGKVASR